MVTLTESFSPLESELHNLPCWSPKQKCALSYTIPFYTMYTTTRLNQLSPASASSNQPARLAWSANCVAGNFYWDADIIFNCYFNRQVICIGKTRGWGRCVVYKMNPLQILYFFCNFFNNDDITEMFAYLGCYRSPKSICIGYSIHSGSSGNVTFGTLCNVCDVTQHYW